MTIETDRAKRPVEPGASGYTDEYPSAEQVKAVSAGTDENAAAIEKLLNGRYKVTELLGAGAQGSVYRGRNVQTGQDVAIKQMRIGAVDNWKQYDLFRREADVLGSLDIDGVAHFYEAAESLEGANPISVIIQEFIDGRSLQSYLADGRRFRFKDACVILLQLLNILEQLHRHEPPVIHRDVKPSNIILHYDSGKYSVLPKVYLIDFGAVANPQVQGGGSTVTGTYGYMAPEQLIGHPTPASDIYSFAVLGVYLLSGTPPEGIEMQDLQLMIDPHLENLPYVVTILFRQMLEKNSMNRLCDYDLIRDALEKFSEHNFNIDTAVLGASGDKHFKFEDVMQLGQAGNVELWRGLQDTTPRKIPIVYEEMIIRDSGYVRNKQVVRLPYEDGGLSRTWFAPIRSFRAEIKTLAAIDIICGIMLIVSSLIFSFSLMYLLIAAEIILLLAAANVIVSYRRRLVLKQWGNLIRDGRKSLATVDEIECCYKEAETQFIENAADIDVRSAALLADRINHRMKCQPVIWRVKYSFNPPDDDDPLPLQHVYYSALPVNLKKGDSLPILYGFEERGGHEYVVSMPFPIPVSGSLLQCNGYIGRLDVA